MSESEKVYVFDKENATEQMEISGGSVYRIGEIMKAIKAAGLKPDWNKIYNNKILIMETEIMFKSAEEFALNMPRIAT